MRRARFVLWVCVLCMTGFSGCTSVRLKMTVDAMEPLLEEMNTAVNKNNDVQLVKDALPASLIQLDGIIEASPNNTNLLVKAAEAYYGYSFVFVEDEDRARAGRLYYKSFQYALRALKQNKRFAKAFEDGSADAFAAGLEVLGKRDVPALFWTASSWLSWAGLNVDDPEIFLALTKIEAMLKRCCELNESYRYGAAHTALGTLYASRSVALGGDPEKARAEFDRAFEISQGKLLVFHLMYAKYYAYQVQDREVYVSTLNHVISAPDDLLPEMGFINAAARQKAQRLIQHVDDVF